MSDPKLHPHLKWAEIDRRQVFDGHIFKVLSSRRRSAEGKEATYTLVDSPDWCNVVAVVNTDAGVPCFVMVRQYRQGSQTIGIEFPGGVVDPGETAEAAALRELEEETGYTAASLTLIGKVSPNPAFMNNTVSTFWAVEPRPAAPQQLDEHEYIDVELIPITDIVGSLPGEFHIHAIMMAALHWYTRFADDALSYDERIARSRLYS